jgi:hypothetical protein
MKKFTLNQLIDLLLETFNETEIQENPELKNIKQDLYSYKLQTSYQGNKPFEDQKKVLDIIEKYRHLLHKI